MCEICPESNTGIWKLQVICMVEQWTLKAAVSASGLPLSSHIKTNEETLEGVFSLLLYIFMISFCQYTIKQFLNNSLNIKTENSLCGKHYANCHFPQRSGVQPRMLEAVGYKKPLFQSGWNVFVISIVRNTSLNLEAKNNHNKYL